MRILMMLLTMCCISVYAQTMERDYSRYAPEPVMELYITCPPSPVQIGTVQPIVVCYLNNGGKAKNVDLYLYLTGDATFVSATSINGSPGVYSSLLSRVHWQLQDINTNDTACSTVLMYFNTPGTKNIIGRMIYQVGDNNLSVSVLCTTAATTSIVTNLLRYSGVTSLDPLSPPASVIFPLTVSRDLEALNFTSGAPWNHDQSDLLPSAPVLVFYQLELDTNAMMVTRDYANNKIVITY